MEVTLSPFIKFKILDFAGTIDYKELNPPEINYIENCGALIFVMDVKSESYRDAINYLLDTIGANIYLRTVSENHYPHPPNN